MSSAVSAIKRPFFVGSRYGRSDYFGNQKQLSVAPRNDRFFLQSRYGKRSMELTTNNFSEQLDRQHSSEEEDVPLICLFTGVADLYRCRNFGWAFDLCSRADPWLNVSVIYFDFPFAGRSTRRITQRDQNQRNKGVSSSMQSQQSPSITDLSYLAAGLVNSSLILYPHPRTWLFIPDSLDQSSFSKSLVAK